MKGLVWFHRWIGIFLCLMFATWFATGAVMVFVAFPSLSDDMRTAHSELVDLQRVRLSPLEAAARLGGQDLQLESLAGAPMYLSRGDNGKAAAISAEDGAARGPVSAQTARDIATRFGQAPVRTISGPFDYDQWIVHQQFDRWRPFYRARLEGPGDVDLYVSARTGQVLQRTQGYERGWNWLGSVVHWIYFVPIRKTFAVWDWTVWVLALVGLSTTVAGLWLGISRTRKKMASKRPDVSPFRGLLRWHHILGLAAGAFVLCWITSGWLSMDHGRLFSEGQPSAAAAAAYQRGAGAGRSPALAIGDLAQLGPATSIAFQQVDGHAIAAAQGPGGPRVISKGPEGAVLGSSIPTSLLIAGARAAWPGLVEGNVVPVAVDSAYAKAEGLPKSALLVKLGGAHPARLYLDGVSGRILVVMDQSREAYAWLYYMVHTYNYPGLSDRPTLRIAILLIPLSLGFAFAVTGVLVGVRRLRAKIPAPSVALKTRGK